MSKTTTLADIVSANGTLIVPTGTTAGRPSATAGSIRFNTDLNTLESANGTAWANVGSGAASSGSGGVSWQPVQNTNFIAVVNNGYLVNTATGNVTVTLPTSPTFGQIVQFSDYGGTFSANNLTIYPNGNKIQGNTSNVLITNSGASVGLVYTDTNKGWVNYTGFPSSVIGPYAVDYLIVAGGGAGGASTTNLNTGGGGAGGLISGQSLTIVPGTSYSVTVGAGAAGSTTALYGANGGNSSLFGLTAIGGGGGGGGSAAAGQGAGRNGGSGGGAMHDGTSGSSAVGQGTAGQGYNGGTAGFGTSYGGGGGGGAGGVGGNGSSTVSGSGGPGATSSISGSSVTYAGGGGGAVGISATGGAGGTGGGGAGGSTSGTSGSSNTGGGGGGAGNNSGSVYGGSGGSGIVIIRYVGNLQKATGGNVTISNGYVIHTFTSSGTFIA